MTPRWDAHIHLFAHGFEGRPLRDRVGIEGDEVDAYAHLMNGHMIEGALVVGYAAEPWCAGNTAYLASLAADRPWVHPVVFPTDLSAVTRASLEHLKHQGFIGLSLYLFTDDDLKSLDQWPNELWSWLEANAWLISVNGKAPAWDWWADRLTDHPRLRLLISHMGLPERADEILDDHQVRDRLAACTRLAGYPNTCCKLSGFYALMGRAVMQRLADRYISCLSDAFGPERLLWGSDFSPHLDTVSFEQTITVVESALAALSLPVGGVMGGNLQRLIQEARQPRVG